jgi:hypothetical protein
MGGGCRFVAASRNMLEVGIRDANIRDKLSQPMDGDGKAFSWGKLVYLAC